MDSSGKATVGDGWYGGYIHDYIFKCKKGKVDLRSTRGGGLSVNNGAAEPAARAKCA